MVSETEQSTVDQLTAALRDSWAMIEDLAHGHKLSSRDTAKLAACRASTAAALSRASDDYWRSVSNKTGIPLSELRSDRFPAGATNAT